MSLKDRLAAAMEGPPKVSQAALARACGVKPPSVSDWMSGRTQNLEGLNLIRAAEKLGVGAEWLATGVGPMHGFKDALPSRYRIAEASQGEDESLAIEISEVRGSCGGGSVNWSDDLRPPLLKEAAWFRRYKIKPKDAQAVWADGDSMADFIVDGDIVIFDQSKRTPKSGQIFLIDHPEGLRIKRLRRDIDGSWILESNSRDKAKYPDERVTPDHAELLAICGEFVYRQGG